MHGSSDLPSGHKARSLVTQSHKQTYQTPEGYTAVLYSSGPSYYKIVLSKESLGLWDQVGSQEGTPYNHLHL